jgi:predicted transcriptional regulator
MKVKDAMNKNKTVESVMVKNILIIDEDDTVKECANLC